MRTQNLCKIKGFNSVCPPGCCQCCLLKKSTTNEKNHYKVRVYGIEVSRQVYFLSYVRVTQKSVTPPKGPK